MIEICNKNAYIKSRLKSIIMSLQSLQITEQTIFLLEQQKYEIHKIMVMKITNHI